MLIPFNTLVDKFRIEVDGILHVGAHLGEEAQAYFDLGVRNVVWVEGNPDLISPLTTHIEQFQGQRVVQGLCSEFQGDEVIFHVTRDPEGTAMSSSLLELEVHKIHAPWVKEVEQKKLRTTTIDDLCFANEVRDCNFINLDIQGAELLALKGAENFLQTCLYIYTEVNTNYLYKNCVLLPELDSWLGDRGFSRVETVMTKAEWGDAFYVRS